MKTATILISTYNKKEAIENCIKSVISVDYPEKKIFVVDNYSTDGSYEILEKYKNHIELHQYKSSLAVALNWAISQIESEYIAFTDADCVVDKNWLKELINGFDEENLIATAGYCGTPDGLNLFQTLIGLELEKRFKKLPLYISRAPTMNLCVKKIFANKVEFDDSIPYGIEVDYGYKLTKFGKMKYVPSAKILHYHRSSLKSYINQQSGYAKGGIKLVLKYKNIIKGDDISEPRMVIQIPLFIAIIFCLIGLIFNKIFLIPSILLSVVLLSIYILDIQEILKRNNNNFVPKIYYLLLFPLFLIRTISWFWGTLAGTLSLFKEVISKLCKR
ncbi:MAG TPA: hypothetical protein DCP53_02465 [Elusimicrobia bacterium]|nr:hypothetical protein [Elusimicrobiota bacterium]